MKVIIAGSRNIPWGMLTMNVALAMAQARREGIVPTEIVSGHAIGVDQAGEAWAEVAGLPVKLFPVTSEMWEREGKAAGPNRNRRMAEYADALVAIWDGKSRGTESMIRFAREKGLKVHVHTVRTP